MLSWPEKGRQRRVLVAGSGMTRRACDAYCRMGAAERGRSRERERQLLDLAWSRIGVRDPLATASASSPLLSPPAENGTTVAQDIPYSFLLRASSP